MRTPALRTDPNDGQRGGLPVAEATGPRMGRTRLVLLGWRMSVATRDGRRRLLLAGIGSALAMLVLLLGMGAVTARDAQQQRIDDRTPMQVDVRPTDGLAIVSSPTGLEATSWYHDVPVTVATAVPMGTPPPPPGLAAFPAPGQIAASPEFARLVASDPVFAARYPGQVVATIGPAGLAGPNEVFAWIAVTGPTHRQPFASGYGLPDWVAQAQSDSQETADLAVPLGVLLFVLPVLILVGTSTRLGSAQRDQRMAAMRLVGAAPGEVRLVSAAEAGGIGALGVLGGLVLFAAVRPLVGFLPWRPGIFPADLAPVPALVAIVAVALPLLGVAAGYVSQRRVVASPLGVSRRAAPKAPAPWRLIPLAIGVALLLVMLFFPQLVNSDELLVYFLLLGGAGFTLLGLVLATPLVGSLAARGLLRIGGLPLAGQLGARRVQADPTTAGRLVTGTAVLAFVVTWVLAAFLPVLDQAQTGFLDQEHQHVAVGTVSGLSRLDTVEQLRAIPGVRAVAPTLLGEPIQTSQEDDDWTGNATIGDCAAIGAMLRDPLPQCAPGVAYPIGSDPTDAPLRLIDRIDHRAIDVDEVHFDSVADYPAGPDLYPISAALRSLGLGDYLLPASNAPSDLPADWPAQVLVGTDGSPDTIEAVKSVMAASTGIVPSTLEDQKRSMSAEQGQYTLLLLAYLIAIALIGVVSLAVAGADDLRTRARSIAGLAAAGTPTRTLRRASLVQLTLTLIPAVALSLAAATMAGWMYSELWLVDMGPGAPRPFDATVIGAVGVGAIVIVLAAYALTLPTLRSAVDLRGLRTI